VFRVRLWLASVEAQRPVDLIPASRFSNVFNLDQRRNGCVIANIDCRRGQMVGDRRVMSDLRLNWMGAIIAMGISPRTLSM
jgi:hypothetical protein